MIIDLQIQNDKKNKNGQARQNETAEEKQRGGQEIPADMTSMVRTVENSQIGDGLRDEK